MIEFSKYVKMYESYKARHNLGSGISRNEIKELRESYSNESKKERILESRRKESNDSYVAPAKRKVNSPADKLRERFVKAKEGKMSSSARISAIKEANKSSFVSEKDEDLSLNKKLNEARKAYLAAKKALREGDIPGAIDQSAIASDAASQAVDAVGAQTVASPEVVSTVQNILSMVQNLAASIGAAPQDTGITPEADPNAAVPAQVDQPLEPVVIQESDTIKAVKARIAERKAKMDEKIKEVESLNESAATDQIIAGMKAGSPLPQPKRNVDKAVSELPKAPSVSEVENGTAKGVVRWPNKAITKDPSANQLGKGAVVNETEEKTLDELAVDKVLNEKKLNFKEIFSNGIITAK